MESPLFLNNEGYEFVPAQEVLPEFTAEELDVMEVYSRDHV